MTPAATAAARHDGEPDADAERGVTGPEKYTGVLAATDVFTASTTFHVMQSIRLELGYGSQVHP